MLVAAVRPTLPPAAKLPAMSPALLMTMSPSVVADRRALPPLEEANSEAEVTTLSLIRIVLPKSATLPPAVMPLPRIPSAPGAVPVALRVTVVPAPMVSKTIDWPSTATNPPASH